MKFSTLFTPLALATLTPAFLVVVNLGERKCFYKDLSAGTLLQGRFATYKQPENLVAWVPVGDDVRVTIDVEEVFDHDHRTVHQKSSGAGEFTFNTLDSGLHRICLLTQSNKWINKESFKLQVDLTVGDSDVLDLKGEDEASQLANMVGFLNLRIVDIKREQHLMREREELFRDQSEGTNLRVVFWSLLQVAVLGGTCWWQMQSLKGFFVKQKLL